MSDLIGSELVMSGGVGDPRTAAEAVSLSLLFSLGRQYLDMPLEDTGFIHPLEARTRSGVPPARFLRLEQVGIPASGPSGQPLTALQTALTACHDPGRYTLVFVVDNDGTTSRFYLGVRDHSEGNDVSDFVSYLGGFIRGNWPGTRLVPSDPPGAQAFDHTIVVTGVPSLKPADQAGYPQSLDRLLRGLRGHAFRYIVIAEPMPEPEVNETLRICRDLIGRVHTLARVTRTSGLSQSRARTASDTTSEQYQVGSSHGTGRSNAFNVMAVLGAIGALFPPAGFLTNFASAGYLLGPSASWSSTEAQTESTSKGQSRSVSVQESWSQSNSLGEEYVNAHAQAAEKEIGRYAARLEQARALGCWSVGVYLQAPERATVVHGGTQLRALLSGAGGSLEPIRTHDLESALATAPPDAARAARSALAGFRQPRFGLCTRSPRPAAVDHPLGPAFSGLSTPLSTDELALLVNLPRREVPGVSLLPAVEFSLNPPACYGSGLDLGTVLDAGEPSPITYRIPTETLAKHALVAGVSGSGKSTTVRHILDALRRRVPPLPFLVIEPAKDEYVAWAVDHNASLPEGDPGRIAIYMPGARSWRGVPLAEALRLNPFDIVWLDEHVEPQVLSHVDRLRSVLTAAFPMQEVLPILLEELIYHVYHQRATNWLATERPRFGTYCPTISQMLCHVGRVVAAKGYEERVTANLSAALKARLQSLRRGWKRTLFDSPRSTPWARLFERPAVINLSQLGDDGDKCLAMSLLLQFLYEYRQAERSADPAAGTAGAPLRHVTVVEEAHRVMLKPAPTGVEQASPQAKAAEAFANMLSEVRAYGEGFIIADQVPGRLVPDAIKNTNLKIVHRLIAQDDRDAMAGCMSMTADQAAIMTRLRPGQAIVFGDLDDSPFWVKVAEERRKEAT